MCSVAVVVWVAVAVAAMAIAVAVVAAVAVVGAGSKGPATPTNFAHPVPTRRCVVTSGAVCRRDPSLAWCRGVVVWCRVTPWPFACVALCGAVVVSNSVARRCVAARSDPFLVPCVAAVSHAVPSRNRCPLVSTLCRLIRAIAVLRISDPRLAVISLTAWCGVLSRRPRCPRGAV